MRAVLDELQASARRHSGPSGMRRLPPPEISLLLFVLGTALAVSPVGRDVDRFFHVRAVTRRDDGLTYVFLHEVLDRLSSQRVVGLLLVAVALWLAWRGRTLAPLVVAGLAQAFFALTGAVKIVLGKSATKLGDPQWWDGGILADGKYSMAYPSGHATESVLLWGTVLLLLTVHAGRHRERVRSAGPWLWRLVVANTVVVSWLLGRHWVSDLASGLVFGTLCLALVVGVQERGYPQAVSDLVLPRLRGALASLRTSADAAGGPGRRPEPPHDSLSSRLR